MIALVLLQVATTLAPLGRQDLPAAGCAAFLWSGDDHRLVAMASGDPANLRIALDGKPTDLPRAEQHGDGGYGLPATGVYRAGDVAATLDLTVTNRSDLSDGALVPQATLRIEAPGRDTLVMPLAGMIGCRKRPS